MDTFNAVYPTNDIMNSPDFLLLLGAEAADVEHSLNVAWFVSCSGALDRDHPPHAAEPRRGDRARHRSGVIAAVVV